mmetsp:Transcript_27291/g.88179  ORF Transcript_27291/g.88179 Transcript_27291/m.88179 type:complete len:213 (-) Transcript_27291:73-711(-)
MYDYVEEAAEARHGNLFVDYVEEAEAPEGGYDYVEEAAPPRHGDGALRYCDLVEEADPVEGDEEEHDGVSVVVVKEEEEEHDGVSVVTGGADEADEASEAALRETVARMTVSREDAEGALRAANAAAIQKLQSQLDLTNTELLATRRALAYVTDTVRFGDGRSSPTMIRNKKDAALYAFWQSCVPYRTKAPANAAPGKNKKNWVVEVRGQEM